MVVDSDVIIRYLTNDDPAKADRLEKYLSSGNQIILSEVTIAEVYWTMRSFYKFVKEETVLSIEALLVTRGVIANREIINTTLNLLKANNVSYIDAYTAAYALIKNKGAILSFDRGFDRIKGIKRHEP